LRRNTRSTLLLGVALALLTFVVVLVVGNAAGGGTAKNTAAPGTAAVVARVDIPLGTVITADMVENQQVPSTARDATAYVDVSQVIGKTARRNVFQGAQVVQADFGLGSGVSVEVPDGLRAFALYVDEETGVGNIIAAGDKVDVVVSFDGSAIPVAIPQVGTPDWQLQSGYQALTVKAPLLLQDIQVLATIDAAAAQASKQLVNPTGVRATPAPATGTTQQTLTGQPKLVILAVTPDQAEALVFARTTGKIDLVLRGTGDDTTISTSGVILRSLFDRYGVLPPFTLQSIDAFVPR
jgi:Flp pilus assembly protein CpaB